MSMLYCSLISIAQKVELQLMLMIVRIEKVALATTIEPLNESVQVQVSGYNHKQPILLSKIMNKLSVFSVDDKRFEIEKEILARQLRNFKAEQPYTHTQYYLNLLMDNCVWSKEELASALDGMDYCSLLLGLQCAY